MSEVQRRQMTTVLDANIHNVALEGSFDDAQKIVKALFADQAFAARTNLAAVNSINFVRIAAQSVYYFTAAAKLGRPATFVVPTGNFGDVFAGAAAGNMGLTVKRLIVATNANDIIARALATGAYATGKVRQTLSPAMDIQIASNFERALFEASGRKAGWVSETMAKFAASKRLNIRPNVLANLRKRYRAGRADDDETLTAMAQAYAQTGKLIDPHTAVAVAVAAKTATSPSDPVVVLSTAHPAKFPQAVARATGLTPPMPPQLAGLIEREERYAVLPNELGALKSFLTGRIGI